MGFNEILNKKKREAENPDLKPELIQIKEDHIELFERLKKDQFNSQHSPARPEPIIAIDGKTISSPCDITVFVGQSKSGKSGVISAILGGVFKPKGMPNPDTLGFDVVPNYDGKLAFHADTEQSKYNYYTSINSALKRSGRDKAPEWFISYNLRQYSKADRKMALEFALEMYAAQFGGVHIILIDGIADYVSSVNDDKECEEVISWLVDFSIRYSCPLITILHLNPSSMDKGRGHLGSHLERKCESMLLINKNTDGISSIEEKLLRNAGNIPVLQFQWDTEKGYHTSCGKKNKGEDKEKKKAKELESLAIQCFGVSGEMSFTDLRDLIGDITGISERSSKTRISEMKEGGFIDIIKGKYRLGKKLMEKPDIQNMIEMPDDPPF